MHKLMEFCIDKLCNDIEENVPETGRFSPLTIEMVISGTQNIGNLTVMCINPSSPQVCTLIVGVRKQDSDALRSNFMTPAPSRTF